jgi:hypothetical protein
MGEDPVGRPSTNGFSGVGLKSLILMGYGINSPQHYVLKMSTNLLLIYSAIYCPTESGSLRMMRPRSDSFLKILGG